MRKLFSACFVAGSVFFATVLSAEACERQRLVDIAGGEVRAAADLHAVLQKQLCFPEFYGANLDALFDVLARDIPEAQIWIWGVPELRDRLGADWDDFVDTFLAVAQENPNIHFIFLTADGTVIRQF